MCFLFPYNIVIPMTGDLFTMNNLTNFIRIVLSQSKLAMEKGEIPIASVIVDPIDERLLQIFQSRD